jgi:hypothetical protein
MSSLLLYPVSSSLLYPVSNLLLYPVPSSLLYPVPSLLLYPVSSSLLYPCPVCCYTPCPVRCYTLCPVRCYTQCTVRCYTPCQFAAIPHGVRTSLPLALWLRGVSPTTMLPAPSPSADGTAGRPTVSARHPTPCLSASPSLGVDGMPRRAETTLVHPSPLLTSPVTRVDGRLCREDGTQQQSIPLPAHPMLSTAAPLWARAVRDRTSSGSPPTSQREEFLSPAGSMPAWKYETAWASKKYNCHAAFRQRRSPSSRHAPVAVSTAVTDPSTRCPSPCGPSTHQFLRSRQHRRNR